MTWESACLEDVAIVEYGERVVRKRDAGTLYPVYGGGGATFSIDRFNRSDCYIVSRFGMSEWCVRKVDGDFFLNDSGLSVRTADETALSQEFLDLFLLANQPNIYALGAGTAQKNLNVSAFREMLMPIPTVGEQQRIVALLDEATAAVAELEAVYSQTASKVEDLRASALTAELENNDWPLVRLGDVVSVDSRTARPEEFQTTDIYVGLDNIGPDGVLENLEATDATTLKSNKSRFDASHVLFGKLRPYLVNVARPDRPGICSTDILTIRPGEVMSRDFLYWWLRRPSTIERATELSTGATLPRISPKALLEFEVPLPSPETQERIAALLDEVSVAAGEALELAGARLKAAQSLRQSVLEAAFRGEF